VEGEVGRTALSPDGKLLAVADGKALALGGLHYDRDSRTEANVRKLVQVWDLTTRKEKFRIEADCQVTTAGCFSPDGKVLATAGYKGPVQLWDAGTGQALRRMPAGWFEGDPVVLGFNPHGRYVHAVDRLGKFGIWEVRTGKEVTERGSNEARCTGIGYTPDGRDVAWGMAGSVLRVWELATGTAIASLGHEHPLHALAFSADGKILHALDEGGQLLRWNAKHGHLLRGFDLHPHLQRSGGKASAWLPPAWIDGQAAFAPGGRLLAVPRFGSGVVAIDTETGKRKGVLAGKGMTDLRGWNVVFSADGSKLGSFPIPDTWFRETKAPVFIRGIVSGKETSGLTAPVAPPAFNRMQPPVSGALSKDGRRVAVAAPLHVGGIGNPPVYVTVLTGWDATTGKKLGTCVLPGEWQTPVAIAADGRFAAVCAAYGKVFLCDLVTGRHKQTIHGRWSGVVAGPLFSPDGRTFALGTHQETGDTAIRVIEWATRTERYMFSAVPGNRMALAFSPDSRTLASGHPDSTILLWDLTGARGKREWLQTPSTPARLWERLRHKDAAPAGAAIQEFVHRPKDTLALLRVKLKPAAQPPPDAKILKRLIAQLGAERFPDRQAAYDYLAKLRHLAEPGLLQAHESAADVEMKLRLEKLLDALDRLTPEEVLQVRCVEILERIGNAEARVLLKRLAAGVSLALLTREARQALARLEPRKP
jgi:WD40 repeat protein